MKHLKKFNETREEVPGDVFYLPTNAKQDIESCFWSLKNLVEDYKIDHGWIYYDISSQESGFEYDAWAGPKSDKFFGRTVNRYHHETYKLEFWNKELGVETERDGERFYDSVGNLSTMVDLCRELQQAIDRLKDRDVVVNESNFNYSVSYSINNNGVSVLVYVCDLGNYNSSTNL